MMKKIKKKLEEIKLCVYPVMAIIAALLVINLLIPSNMATIQWLDTGETVTMENSYQLGNYCEGDTVWVCTLWGDPGVIYNKQEPWSRKAILIKRHGFIIGGIKIFGKYYFNYY